MLLFYIFQAAAIHSVGIPTFAVAMSKTGTIKNGMRLELEAIASDPYEEHMISKSFNELYLVVDNIHNFICDNSKWNTPKRY